MIRLPFPLRADLPDLAAQYRDYVKDHPAFLDRLAKALGIPPWTLHALRVGWSEDHNAFTFPMVNASGAIIGIRLRKSNGFKFAVTGSQNGLFIPEGTQTAGRLLVCEGPTDCGALISLGFWCIGRPDCSSGVKHVLGYVRDHCPREVAVVADHDEPGTRGADRLASLLRLHIRDVRRVLPPDEFKDARAWVNAGAGRQDIDHIIDSSTAIELQVEGQTHHGRTGTAT